MKLFNNLTFKDLKRRYWVFVIWTYYPSGGLRDIEGAFDNLEDAQKFMDEYMETECVGGDVSACIFDSVERIIP